MDIFENNSLPKTITDYMVGNLGVDTVARLANLFDAGKENEDAMNLVIRHVPEVRDDAVRARIVRADLKQASKEANAANELALKRKQVGLGDDHVGAHGDVIAAAGCNIAHGCNNGFVVFLLC